MDLNRLLGTLDISPTQKKIIGNLYRTREPITQKQMRQDLDTNHRTISANLKPLLDTNIVEIVGKTNNNDYRFAKRSANLYMLTVTYKQELTAKF